MDTDDLITRLAASGLPPVRPARAPGRAMGWWLLASLPALATMVWLMGPRPDLRLCLSEQGFWAGEALAGVTALLAAYAALCAGRPDEPSWKLALPAAALVLWLVVLGRQCFILSVSTQGAALIVRPDMMCVPAIALTGFVPALMLVLLLRKTARFRRLTAGFNAALAAAAAAEAALRLFHPEGTMMTLLVWQMGSVALFSGLGALAGAALRRRA
ncbi:MAG: NrsF family protein [Acidocella sp.]|nr:NrsF family protein [Acidocella sp.]